jgi:hypothetical protein
MGYKLPPSPGMCEPGAGAERMASFWRGVAGEFWQGVLLPRSKSESSTETALRSSKVSQLEI